MIVTSVLTVWQQMGFLLQSRLKFGTPSSFLFTVSLLILLMIMMIFFTLPYNFEMPLLVVIMMLWLLLFMVVIPIREAKRAEFSRSRPSCLPSRLLCHTSLPGKGHHHHCQHNHHWGQPSLWPAGPWWVFWQLCLALRLWCSAWSGGDFSWPAHTHYGIIRLINSIHTYAGCSKCDDQLATQRATHWGRQVLCGATSGRVILMILIMIMIMKALALDGGRKKGRIAKL